MAGKLLLKELSRYPLGTFAEIVHRNALLRADDEAFVYGERRITFAGYNDRVNALVNALKARGIGKGDVIGNLSWNCLEYTYVYGAAMKGGFIASPFSPRMHVDELTYLINYSEASTLFVGPELVEPVLQMRPKLPWVRHFISLEGDAQEMTPISELLAGYGSEEPDVAVKEDDPLIIFYTSGTTGRPRGAVYTHRRKLGNTQIKALELGLEPGDKHVVVIPLFHVGGDSHVWPFFLMGGCNVILPQRVFDPDAALQAIQDEKATDMHIVPTQLVAMLGRPEFDKYDLSSLRRIWYAASPMPVEVLKRGLEVFGPIFMQGYGQTESGPQALCLQRKAHQVLDRPLEEQRVLASCGQPSYGFQVRIVDSHHRDVGPGETGEIILKSGTVMAEYWRRPEETLETILDGWLHTGDVGYYDDRGYIYLVDRKKDMIVTGGENVYPREVEEILYTHPAVAQAAVIGIPDEVWVERVHAVIILKQGCLATEGDIIKFCKERMTRFKAPKSVDFVDSLPISPQGKILKKDLKAPYWKGKR